MNSLPGAKEPLPTLIAEDGRKPLSRRDVANGFLWNQATSIAAKLLFPILQIFFYRRLGPEQIGIYAVLIPIYMICESLRDAGLALTYVADREEGEGREGQYATLAMINAVVFALLIFILRGSLVQLFHRAELNWGLEMVSLAVLLTGFSTIPANKLQKNARFRDASIVDFSSSLLSLICAFALVLLGFGYKALVWQFVMRSVFFTLGCWLIEPVRFTWIRRSVISQVWKHASHNLLNNVSFTVYTVADNLLVTKLFGMSAVGNYNAAYTFGMKPVDFFSSPLAKTLLIAYTRKSHDLEALTKAFVRTISLSVLTMVPLYALVGCFAKPLTVLLLSSKFQTAGPLLGILVLYCACRSVGLLCGNVLVALNKPVLNVYGWLCAYCVVIAILSFNRNHLTLTLVVEALTAGAVCVYSVAAFAAFSILKPRGENARKLWRAVLLAACSVGIACASTWLPFTGLGNFAVGSLAVLAFQLTGVAIASGNSPRTCFTRQGLRRLSAAI
jgi:O-antigen/teichoic acid export membrane protein